MTTYNTEKFGENVKIWIGQIVDDEYWKDNEKREKWSDPDEIPGWGARYKVRIFGEHPEDAQELSDDGLPWIEVLYPVTAGSGHGGSSQTSNLRKGSFVMGIYKDQDNTEPLIIGCLGNNDQTQLQYRQTTIGFVPFSGFGGNDPIDVPTFAEPQSQGNPIEANTNSSPEQKTKADDEEKKDGKKKTPLYVSSKCSGNELSGIRLTLSNLIQDIEKIKRDIQRTSSNIDNFNNKIQSLIQNASESISGAIKWIIDQIRKFTVEKLNNAVKDTYYLLFPNERPELKRQQEKALNLLSCLFNKIISNLLKLIGQFLLQIVDRYINVPLCAVEKLLATLLGEITGLVVGAIDAILSTISGITNLAGDILGFVQELLGFFSCEESQECPEIKEWSIWDGAGNNGGNLNLDFLSIFENAKSIYSNVVSNIDPDNFNIDFSDLIQSTLDGCNVGPILCGPPTIVFYGGGGSGTTGNVIVGATGDILGVDITSFGSGYTNEPFTRIIDNCGNGNGAVVKPVMGILPPILELSATRIINNTYSVSWKTTNAEEVETSFGSNLLSGSINVSPSETTQYTVTAFGGRIDGFDRPYVTKSVTINVSDFENTTFPTTPTEDITIESNTVNSSGSPIPNNNVNNTISDNDNTFNYGNNSGTVGGNGGNGSTDNADNIDNVGIIDLDNECSDIPTIEQLISSKKYSPDQIGVIGVVVVDSGSGYLRSPNGSLGGDGRVWANPDETVVKRSDGRYDTPYRPGDIINLNKCDEINLPNDPTYRSPENTSITAPNLKENTTPRGLGATDNTGKYPVLLYLCDVEIENGGINYDKNDKIKVIPDNGAILEPVFNDLGTLVDVKIIKNGFGFTEKPQIIIETSTGYNAKINSILCVNRLENDSVGLSRIPPQKIVTVIDCVGKG